MLRRDEPKPELLSNIVKTYRWLKEQVATVADGMRFWNYYQLEVFLETVLHERTPTPFYATDIYLAIQDCETKSDMGHRWTPPRPPHRPQPPRRSPQPSS